MRHVRSIDAIRTALVAALGLAPFACGGTTELSSADAGGDAAPHGDGGVLACKNPTPVVVGGIDTGYDRCAGGTMRRRAIVECPVRLPRANATCPVDAGSPGSCSSDADCTAMPRGYCAQGDGGGLPGCFCNYGCAKDSDCGQNEICVCGDPVGYCASATCTSDASCGGSLECADYTRNPGCPGKSFACQKPSDTCFSDADCAMGMQCTADMMTGHRTCAMPMCAVGRPFLVGGEARLAPAVARGDWSAAIAPSTRGIDAATRAKLAAAWTAIGQMEHASIAAFARFALQLMAAGAPPSLVEAAQRAMADETNHARAAFGLASAYAGRDVGPGPLAIDACLDGGDLGSAIATVVHEGCVGETVAAIEAREAADAACDPAVREVLATIARDETRHAELAWRTVAWALGAGDARVRAAASAAFASACAGARGAEREDDLLHHGVVSNATRASIRRAALDELILPCARALLDDARAPIDDPHPRDPRLAPSALA